MRPALNDALLFAGLATWVASFFVLSRFLPKKPAFWVATAKVAIVVAFFGFFNAGQFTLRDDLTYLRNAGIMHDRGFSALEAISTYPGIRLMAILSSGWHIGYLWWNLMAIGLFGDHYFSAIFCNVLLTCLGGWIVRQLALDAGLKEAYANGSAILFLLHWELLAWSSIVNVKDVPVCVLTLALLFGLSRLGAESVSRHVRMSGAVSVVLASVLLFWIRFYVPVLALLGASLWLIASRDSGRRRWGLGVLGLVGVAAMLRGGATFFRLADIDMANALQGSIRFLLTPQPWSVDPKYGFLVLPAIFHLAMFLPAVFGARELARQSSTYRLFLWCGLVFILFYGFVDELQGPRHRLQILALWSWAQWHWAWGFWLRHQPSAVHQSLGEAHA